MTQTHPSLSSIAHTPHTPSDGLTAYQRMNNEISAELDPFAPASELPAYEGQSLIEMQMTSLINQVQNESTDNPFSGISGADNSLLPDSPFYRENEESDLPDGYVAWLNANRIALPADGACDESTAMAYLEAAASPTRSSAPAFAPVSDISPAFSASLTTEPLPVSGAASHDEEGVVMPNEAVVDSEPEPLSEIATELLSLRDQFVAHFKENKDLISKDRTRACEQLEAFDVSWSQNQFIIATAKSGLISERDARERLRAFFEQARALLT